MADQKMSELILLLHKKTHEGKVPWERTLDEDTFQATFKEYTLRLFSRPSREPEAEPDVKDYVLQIYNEEGALIEEVDDLDFNRDDLGRHPFVIMEEIHTVARRTVMGVQKAVNTLLDALKGNS
jgi:hypothetical protein